MARKSKNTPVATVQNEEVQMVVIQDEATTEATTPEGATEATTETVATDETTTTEAATEAVEAAPKKRERGYSQSAIDLGDLDRLNGFKAFIKTKMGVSVSNQRLLNAALNYLGANVEDYLQQLATEVNNKQKVKDLAALEALKTKLGVE